MANWRDVQSASKSIQKTDSIDMKPENRDLIETIMCGLLAGGRTQEFALAAQTLEKIESKSNLAAVLGDLTDVIKTLKKPQQEEATDLESVAAERDALKARLAQLEA